MKKSILFAALFILYSQIWGQSPTFNWSKSTGSTGGDIGRSVVSDAAENVITTGDFSGTVDFDPGTGSFPLTAMGTFNAFIQKLDANGNLLWAKVLNGTSTSRGIDLATDPSGNVYVTGFFTGIIDFDPGIGTDSHDAGSLVFRDYFILKLDSAGNLDWVHTFGATNETVGSAVALDAQFNVIVVGNFSNTVDFDPSIGIDTLTALNKDIFIHKLSPAGNHLWAQALTSVSDDAADNVSTDIFGNVYLTGMFSQTIDFDPGPGIDTFSTLSASWNAYLLKLDSAGNYVWARQMACTDFSTGFGIHNCTNGDVLLTGIFRDSLDTNPGPSTSYIISNNGSYDIFTFRFSSIGNVQWYNIIGGPSDEYGRSITEDIAGNIFLAGQFSDTLDFDPGAGVYTVNSLGNSDIFVQVLNNTGGFISLLQMGGTNAESAQAIYADINSVYITGQFTDTVDLNPYAATATHISAGNTDMFIVKFNGLPNSIDESSSVVEPFIYPNPTEGKFNLSSLFLDKVEEINLFNISGQNLPLNTQNTGQGIQVDISHLPAGVYILTITTRDKDSHKIRVIRQ